MKTIAELLQLAREGSALMRDKFNSTADEYEKIARDYRQLAREQADIVEDINRALTQMRN